MSEEIEKSIEELQLEAIEEMKRKMDSMVDPEEHAKVKREYEKLMLKYTNERPAPKPKEKVVRPVTEVAKELARIKSGDISNRDYIAKSLEYRDSHIHEFGTDPFTDFGQKGPGKENEQTKYVADTLKKLLDENPSPVSFRIALNETLHDDPKLVSTLRKRAN